MSRDVKIIGGLPLCIGKPCSNMIRAMRLFVLCFMALILLSGETCNHNGSDSEPLRVYFNFMTANIWQGARGDRGLDRIACYISNADIVFLQEVDKGTVRSGGVDQPRELAQKSGLVYHAFSVSRPGYDGGDFVGNVILSRYPLSEVIIHKVTAPGWDYHQETIIIQAVVTFFGQRINLFATHYPAGDVNRGPEARQKATEFVLGLIENVQGPVILGGDLNATSERLEIIQLTDKLTDSWNAAPQHREHGSDKRIDYIFFRGPYVVRKYEASGWPLSETKLPNYEKPGCSLAGADLSDHPFVLVRFEIVGREFSPPQQLPSAPPVSTDREKCLQACKTGGDACMAEVATEGGPRPQECVGELNRCRADCPK